MQQRVTVQEGASGVVVRNYKSAADYQLDASSMGAAGWLPISQMESSGKFPAAAGMLAAIGIFVALIVSLIFGLALLGIAIAVGVVSRPKTMVVTYRQNTPTSQP